MFRKGQKLTIKNDGFFTSDKAARTYGIEKKMHEWEASVVLGVNGPADIHPVLDHGVRLTCIGHCFALKGITNARFVSARKTNWPMSLRRRYGAPRLRFREKR